MDVNKVLPETLASRLLEVEARLVRVERQSTVAGQVQVPWFTSAQTWVGVTAFPWYWTFSRVLSGSSLRFKFNVTVQAVGQYCDYDVRYFQESPRIYTDAQIAAGTYVSLGSGRFDGLITSQDNTVTLSTTTVQGTYGRVDVCLQASSLTGGQQSYVAVNNISIF